MFFFLTATVALTWHILFDAGVPVHADLTFPWRLSNFLNNYRYLFTDSGSVPNLESIDRAAVLLPLAYVAKLTGWGVGFVYRIIYFILLPVSMWAMAGLIKKIFEHSGRSAPLYVIVPASLLYALSPWVLEQIQAYLFWLAYAITPLLIRQAIVTFELPSARSAILLAVTLTLLSGTPHYLLFSLVVVGIIGLFEIRSRLRSDEDRSYLRRLSVAAFALAMTFAALNIYWILPTTMILMAGGDLSPGLQADASTTQLFSTNSQALNVLRGFDQWITWYQADERLAYSFNPLWVANSLLIPTLAFAMFLRPAIRTVLSVRVIAFISMAFAVLALGTTTPVYDWLVSQVPVVRNYGWILRVPGKFSYLLWTLYSLMLAFALHEIWISRLRTWAKAFALSAIFLSAAVLCIPKAIVYFHHYYAPEPMPAEYQALNTRMASEPAGTGRVLYLAPYDFSFGENALQFETSFTWNPSRLAAATPGISSPKPTIAYYHLTYRDWQYAVYPQIYPHIPLRLGEKVLRASGVGYVVYHNDIVGGTDRGLRDIARLSRSDLNLIGQYGDIYLFKNPFYDGILHGIRPDGTQVPVHVERIDPTRYRIVVPAESEIQAIRFSQPYDPLWTMKAESETFAPQEFSSTEMEFHLPHQASGDLWIEYLPQRPYEFGLWVSAAASITVLGALWSLRGR